MTAVSPPRDGNRRTRGIGRVWLATLVVAATSALVAPHVVGAADNPSTGGDTVPSTSNYVPTTTIGEPSLDVSAFSSDCDGDLPNIRFAVKPVGFTSSGPATLSFYDVNNALIETRLVPTLSGSLLFPGASADPPRFPGWRIAENGNWEPDPTNARFREGISVRVSVAAPGGTAVEANRSVAYPSSAAACDAPPERALDVSAFSPVCIASAPFISYTIKTLGFVSTGPATLTFYDVNNKLVQTQVVPTLSGQVIYPGASVDANGNATDWPGWKLAENGNWIPDDSDAILRQGLRIEVEVNPTATAQVSYPPSTSTCDGPPEGTPPTTTTPPTTIIPPTTTICVETSSTGGSSSSSTGGGEECYPCVPGQTTGGNDATGGGDPACYPCVPGQTTGGSTTGGAADPSCSLPRTGNDGVQKILTAGAAALAAGVGIAMLARRRKTGSAPV